MNDKAFNNCIITLLYMRGTMILLFFEKKPNKIWTIGKKSLPLHTLLEKSADKAVRMRK